MFTNKKAIGDFYGMLDNMAYKFPNKKTLTKTNYINIYDRII